MPAGYGRNCQNDVREQEHGAESAIVLDLNIVFGIKLQCMRLYCIMNGTAKGGSEKLRLLA